MEPILRGREPALGVLRARLDAALRGRGGVALVSGEPGIGKSAIASAIAQEAQARAALVTWGRAWEFAEAPPYFPLWPCLRSLGIDAGGETQAGHDDFHSFQLGEQMIAALSKLAAGRPAVWILEDLHAADLGTLDLLTFLAQPARAMRLLVVGTIRTPDPRLTDRMMQRLTRIARDGIDVRLQPLSNDAVAAITEATLGRSVPDKELERIVQLTGGNPLFVIECARAFRAAGGTEGTLGSLPPTVRQVVLERFACLPETTREALACGAVLGREFAASAVASMRVSLPARVIDTLLPALRSGLISEPNPGRFVFSHAIVRDAIEDSLEADERARVHGLAEAALATLGDTAEVLLERARHALAALRSGNGEVHALDLAQRALARLEREGAFDRAFDLQTRIEDACAAGFLPRATPAQTLERARVARAAGRSEASRKICLDVIAVARGSGDAETLARAALFHAADVRPGVIDSAQVSLLEEARDGLGDLHPKLHCRVLARLATALQPARDLAVPIRLTHEAIAGARATGDDGALVDVLELAAWGLYTAPLAERIAVATELCDRALAKGDVTKAIAGSVMLAFYQVEASDFVAFGSTVETLLALSETIGHPRQRWRALLLASMRATMLGHFTESERYVTEVTQLAALIDEPALPWTLGLHEIFRARAERRDNEVRDQLVNLEELLRGSFDAALFAALIQATCAARIEDVPATRAALAIIGSRTAALLADPGTAGFIAEAYAVAGTDEERRAARDVLRTTRPSDISGEVMSFIYEGTVVRLLGLLDAALGELAAAERELREAHALAVARRHTPWVAQTGYELAKVLQRAGRQQEARELMTASLRIASELGMSGLPRSGPAVIAGDETATGAAPALSRTQVTIEKQGSDYCVSKGATVVRLKDSRGMQLLARLVENQAEEIHVLALSSDEPVASVPESSAGELLDDTAKRAYRARIADLEGDIAEAERCSDAGRSAKLQVEKAALLSELTRALGLGGRVRQAGSATERARVNVQRRLKDAIAKISEADAELGRFFEHSVRTGTFCCFRPK